MTKPLSPALSRNLEGLLQFLAYTPRTGWLDASRFDTASSHRFALMQARDFMSVAGAFCWLSGESAGDISVPIVYIAVAENRNEAKSIHRKVWSQGLVPFLVVATPDELILCRGFDYAGGRWEHAVSAARWSEIPAAGSEPASPGMKALDLLRSSRLRSSVFWRDYAVESSGRVDRVLLSGLTGLSDNLINGVGVSKPLAHTAANALIGKLLYLYCLVDRDVIGQAWLDARGHGAIDLAAADAVWPQAAFWKLLDDLDAIFNGSVFPVKPSDRARIDETHIGLAKAVLKHGAQALTGGAIQLSLLDVDLGVLRVETLSAVYEQFLENVKSGERRRVGAYYTPPFLADLVLDRIEDEMPLQDGVTVMDPAAGSGVFLVGAYRRILEHARMEASAPLSLDEVRGLLERNIFGVERNPDACHVAAFSLYLTMLDYVSPRDLTVVAAGQDPRKLFPPLLRNNLFAADFFSNSIAARLPTVHCIVGNPPWQTLGKLGSRDAAAWAAAHEDCPIGKDQAAELFVWKALRKQLAGDGVLGMLIPSKSFVNPTASKFRTRLQRDAYVSGAINFSHLRHRLFAGAKHACAALFVRNRRAAPGDRTWIYAPLSVGQPLSSKDGAPWTLTIDTASIQSFRHEALAEDPHGWFDAFMLSPVDREIRQYVFDMAESGAVGRLGDVCKRVGARYKRGGNEHETGLESGLLLGADTSAEGQSDKPGRTADLFAQMELDLAAREPSRLPAKHLASVDGNYRSQFSGNILLVPRSFAGVRFVDYPIAYNSSYIGVFFDKAPDKPTAAEKRFLRALGCYLRSGVALYFLSTTGRRWLIDRSNVEPADFGNLPVPFTSLDDPRIGEALEIEGAQADRFFLKAFGLDRDLRSAIEEFLRFRLGFKDGNVPGNALVPVREPTFDRYLKVFQRSLDGFIGRQRAFDVAHQEDPEAGVGVVVARYVDDRLPPAEPDSAALASLCSRAVESNRQHGHNAFGNSAAITVSDGATLISVVKPLEYFRWTIDSAYADSRRVIDVLLKEAV